MEASCHAVMVRLLTRSLLYRHHVRFFPRKYVPVASPRLKVWVDAILIVQNAVHSPHEADKSGNCPAGLLVDKEITNPNYEDFYLQSHAGLLGSAYPPFFELQVQY